MAEKMRKTPRLTRPKAARLVKQNTAGIEKHQFQPGYKPPGGRPKGSRNKLQGDFIVALSADFDRYGVVAIARAREEDPLGYVRVIASLMPKEMEIKRPLEEMREEDLLALLAQLRQAGADLGLDDPLVQDEPKQIQ